MRALIVMAVLLVSGICHAEDPLESLNTVQDALSAMQRTLQAHDSAREEGAGSSEPRGGGAAAVSIKVKDLEESFVSQELLGASTRVRVVTPCS